ncbi:MAG TPA: hypothetical protein VD838_02955 [Anaeromyxobacteraceae bacterium]|nr:hypothetical protein [Anaeromyxobacteraceae bacterium]
MLVYTPGRVLTEGQRLLCTVPGRLADLSAAVGVGMPTICQWRRADRVPGTEHRRRLFDAFGIPVEAWDSLPIGAAVFPTEDEPEDEPEDDAEADDLEDEDEPEPVPEPRRRRNRAADEPPDETRSALDDYNVLLGQLRKQLAKSNLPSRERIQVTDAMTRALAHKERLERSREMIEARTIKEHPKWRELKAAIIGALLEHPAAARDVEAAITRVLGDEGAVP